MAHFAQLDENNTVINVIVVADEDILDENGNESEEVGILFCKNLYEEDTRWLQTSYNGNIRFRFAGIGMVYSEQYDAFYDPINPCPNSWYFDESQLKYKPPVKRPKDGKMYYWNEEIFNWTLVEPESSWTLAPELSSTATITE